MGKLVDGEWKTDWYEPDEAGRFVRPDTVFHDWVTADGSSGYQAAAGQYHLYVSYACPWAHRTLLVRALKGLEHAITVSVVHPVMGDDGWSFADDFPGATGDELTEDAAKAGSSRQFLRELYVDADPQYTGRVTVPVLWDKQQQKIVNNESRDILRMLDCEFDAIAEHAVCFAPGDQQALIDSMIDSNYEPINNGVYRCGFATSQSAYEEAFEALFDALDRCEALLSRQRYLCGSQLTEADICLFTTLIRFDAVYVGHFKCNRRRIVDYPNLWNYIRDIYQLPGVAETCRLDHIKTHYYRSHPSINPNGLVPVGPDIDFSMPHDRERFA